MSAQYQCFENIIGLSRTECPCLEDGRPVDWNVSASGRYADELEGMNLSLAENGGDCSQGGVWDMLHRARENAVQDMQTDLLRYLEENTDVRRQAVRSTIGDDKKSGNNVALNSAYHGLTVQMAHMVGGRAKLKRIGAAFNYTGTLEVALYDREGLLATWTVNTVANRVQYTELPDPYLLSMDAEGSLNARYWLVYTPSGGIQAKSTRINCGCGGFAPYWDEARPQYESSVKKNGRAWADWAMAQGTKGTDLDVRDEWSLDNQTYGLLMDIEFYCDTLSSICTDDPDYSGDSVQRTIADAVWYRTGVRFYMQMMVSKKVNPAMMVEGELIAQFVNDWNVEYTKRINEQLGPILSSPEHVNRYGDCRACRDKWGMQRSTILVTSYSGDPD